MTVWNPLIELSEEIKALFNEHLTKTSPTNHFFENWQDDFWHSDKIRKCHLKTIDNRETQKTWLLHINIFPNTDQALPILGFDIVAGKNKITGSFFDFSPVAEDHPYMDYFKSKVSDLEWNKPRELPDWAREIFSDSMIAVGNLREGEEIQQLSDVSLHLIKYYLDNIDKVVYDSGNHDIKQTHNKYCSNQKMNPHLHRSILSMGISETDKDHYVNNHLFQEI